MVRLAPRSIAGVAAVLMLLMAGCSPVDRSGGEAAVQARTLIYAIAGTDQVPEAELAWAKNVEQNSAGSLKIEFITEYAPGDPHQLSRVIADVRSGAIDLGRVAARVFDANGYDEFQPLLAPFLVDNYDLQAKVFQQGIPAQMASGLDRIGLKPLGTLPGHLIRTMSREAPFTSLSAYQGAEIAAQESMLTADVFAALGAHVTPLAGGQFDLTGVDAVLNTPASVWGNQFQSTWRHLTANLNFWPTPLVIMANPELFNSLEKSQQDALTGAASATLDYALRVTADSEADAMDKLCAAGTTLDAATDSQLAELEAAVRPVIDTIRADPAKAGQLDRIEALKFEVGAAPTTLGCGPLAGPQMTESLGIPDGTYTRTVTVGDLRQAGADNLLNEVGIDVTDQPDTASQQVKLVLAGGLLRKYNLASANGETDEESFTYTTYRGRIRLSGPVDIVASYTYHDDELRFSDFSFPDCADCFGYEVSFGFVPQPWVRQD
jgi:TRAP-type C4-dicarboxylate transport system substrate-binding protein